ncbi:M1 family aminopeptidase [Modestobacter sp. VKM Ac-2984]|uniref:M1 family aminopeptidase n=1 Tax=Modestobacter sp. VKM Ac-2984 TaxID=3004138 RepID=UPI0022AA6D18|nr:M1 family aminopeptidase [Modestobacter sp. VKM Ac-2984]MCZ2818562.1 M1 family aminopeptidase [Modestobacter sp. VKM Ac-2984]
MHAGRRRAAAAALAGAVLLAGCTTGGSPDPEPPPTDAPEAEGWAEPWADRPVVDLRFDVAEDLETVAGEERVVFTPDLNTCVLVFRSWPNKPATARAGSGLTVSEVRVDGEPAEARDVPAGAPESAPAGTLLEVPLAECADAGDEITVDIEFEVELGPDVNERVGTSTDVDAAWFATAFPLLAWERGRGWDRSPGVAVAGEMAVSEDFELASLEVVADSRYEVLGTGEAVGTSDGPGDTTVHEFTAPSVRDVAVTVGELDVQSAEIGGVRVHVGLDEGVAEATTAEWLAQLEESMAALVELLGPFPYDDLWVSVLSSQTSGIEFPGAVQFGDVDPDFRRALVTHELAHMWFYGLVGNNQGVHPWLDESFATFAQMVVHGEGSASMADLPGSRRHGVGEPIQYWEQFRRPSSAYYDTVYIVGGTTLVDARAQVGAETFDAALREYLRANAWSIATPEDVQDAFAEFPEVLDELAEVGALP